MVEQSVTLQPGESKVVSFEATPTVAKTYLVSVNGLTGSFMATTLIPLQLSLELTPLPAGTFLFGVRARNLSSVPVTFRLQVISPRIGEFWLGWQPKVEPGEEIIIREMAGPGTATWLSINPVIDSGLWRVYAWVGEKVIGETSVII